LVSERDRGGGVLGLSPVSLFPPPPLGLIRFRSPHPPLAPPLLSGVANLDKRGRAAAEARRLSSLGFPAAKGPRIPASIGYGRAAKQKELAAAALEAAIDAGLISRSSLGKKKRRAAEAARRAAGDGGAGSLDGSGPLRNGVLFVKEAPAKKRKGPGGGRRFNIDKIKL
jgi:hypothetical protein